MRKDDIMTLTGEKDACPSDKFSRRKFFGAAAMAAAGAALAPRLLAQEKVQDEKPPAEIKTNIDEVRGIPRVATSLPGKYPGKVVRVKTGANPVGQKIDGARVAREIEAGMAKLTGEKKMGKAWGQFVGPKDVVGWAKDNIDREALPYVAEVEMKYDKELMGYMLNEGKSSYFTKIVAETVTKIVNVPILKNAGTTTTCCLKNLSYGSISNTSRLHKLWMSSVVEPCAFPVLRDKVVLNIVDGLQACYDGGPGANPKFIYDSNVFLLGTDPVAVDAVAHDIIIKERIARGTQQVDDPRRRSAAFLDLAEKLGLGIAARDKIEISDVG